MLQHEETPPSEAVPFAERRITPHELTRALSSIEAHREEDARRQEEAQRRYASTLTVDEAVSTLSLDVTPDQLWAEVEALREADGIAPPGPPPVEPDTAVQEQKQEEEGSISPLRVDTIGAVQGASPLAEELPQDALQTWDGIAPESHTLRDNTQSGNASGVKVLLSFVGGGIALAWLLTWLVVLNTPSHAPYSYQPSPTIVTQPYQPTYTPLTTPRNSRFFGNNSDLSTHLLSTVPDEKVFGLTRFSLNLLLNGQPQDKVRLFDNERDMLYDRRKTPPSVFMTFPLDRSAMHRMWTASEWTAIKHDDIVYLSGWANAQDLHNGTLLRITNTPTAQGVGSHPVQVTIPLTAITYQGTYQYSPPRLYPPASAIGQTTIRPHPYRYPGMGVMLSNVHLDKHAYEKWTP